MTHLNIGKGVYLCKPATIERGDPQAIVARLKLAGVQTAVLKICDGFRVLGDLEPLIQSLRDQGIRVGAWGYSYLNRAPLKEARAVAEAFRRYAPDFYLMHVEKEAERNFDGARLFLNELRPAAAGMPLGLSTFSNARLNPQFPWLEFLKAVDFICPQVYGYGAEPVARLIETQHAYAELPGATDVPMPVVAGQMHVFKGQRPTAAQLSRLLSAADADPFIDGVIMWAADGTQTTADLWQAFCNYEWTAGARMMPQQPLGWIKIIAAGGLWVRSSPAGRRLGNLAREELAPVWAVTATQWGAITREADQWIFLGGPSSVETPLEIPGLAASPASVSELFQARVVPRRGLNVRQGMGGRVLRALQVDSPVRVYEASQGWARIHPAQDEWVRAAFLRRVTA